MVKSKEALKKVNLWEVTATVGGAIMGLVFTGAVVATIVKWLVWAGSGWLW